MAKTDNQPIPKGSIYKWKKDMVEYQLFPEAFFSGADVKIYFGDIFVDDIIGITFVLQEQLKPIYSYASRTYKEISRGNRIVQGKFYIAFREAGYLSAVLDHIGQLDGINTEPEISAVMKNGGTRKAWHGWALQRYEDMLKYYSTSTDGINPGSGPEVDTAEVRYANYEREIWGRRSSLDTEHEGKTFFYTSRSKEEYQKKIFKDGFDIFLTYGPIERTLGNSDRFGATGLNNQISGVSFETTVKALRGVQIHSTGQEIGPDGTVIEAYDFLAKDIDA